MAAGSRRDRHAAAARPCARVCAILFTLTALLSVLVAEAGNGYDARYGYPAFGPLAGAALGAWGLAAPLGRGPRRGRRTPQRTPAR